MVTCPGCQSAVTLNGNEGIQKARRKFCALTGKKTSQYFCVFLVYLNWLGKKWMQWLIQERPKRRWKNLSGFCSRSTKTGHSWVFLLHCRPCWKCFFFLFCCWFCCWFSSTEGIRKARRKFCALTGKKTSQYFFCVFLVYLNLDLGNDTDADSFLFLFFFICLELEYSCTGTAESSLGQNTAVGWTVLLNSAVSFKFERLSQSCLKLFTSADQQRNGNATKEEGFSARETLNIGERLHLTGNEWGGMWHPRHKTSCVYGCI